MAVSRRDSLILGGMALAAAAAGLIAAHSFTNRTAAGADLLKAASLADLTGSPARVAEWNGKILVCNFWATWCAPCREEIPMLMGVRNSLVAFGVEVLGIAIDHAAKVVEYAANMKISYPVLVADANGLELMRRLGNTAGGLPYTVIFDRQGAAAHRKLGALRKAELEAMLAGLLKT